MTLTKSKLGELIELVDERNSDGLRNFHGVNIDKEFMPTVADTSTLDEKKYKVVRKNRFACNLMHVGRDAVIPIAFHREDEPIVVSPAYVTFEITATDRILPEYFFMIFQSKEKDRLGWFLSDSSVRGNIDWKTFCDIEINLPPLDVQKRFVAIYNTLIENRKAYERGLDDLKLVCDGYIKKLLRNLPCEKLDNYISLSDERNVDNFYTAEDVRGISIDKKFISTKADMEGVSLKNYLLVKPEAFAFVPVTSRNGGKISIAQNDSGKNFICSTSYVVFSTDAEKLSPQYLMLFFNRSEFDRYARFHSWGSARETFTWKDLCEVEIPIPEMKIQRSIAAVYEVYRTRKKILERLKEQIKDICPILIKGSEIHRTKDETLLLDDLRDFISTRYADENLSSNELQTIENKLSLINSTPLYTGNREAFFLVNEGFDLLRDDTSKVALHFEYIDFDAPGRNIFKVVSQFPVQGDRLRRPDLLIFVNGIPIAICEFKSAIREDATIHDAWEQIFFRYSRDIPKLLRYSFLAVISDGVNTKLGSIFAPYENFYSWNKISDTEEISDGIGSLFTMIKGAFAKERFLQILRDFIFYPDDAKDVAIVCRYPQFFAATKMFANIKAHLRPIGDGKGGTYFGATGCGKTYTMLFLARLIIQRDNETFRNPTIIILTDREDLDTQTSELFVAAKKFLHEEDVRSIESRADLQTTLKNRPSGGVYVITIQKFCEELGELSTRENIICFSDEAHRTQTNTGAKLKTTDAGIFTTYGFAHYLRRSFPNATYCGFTGTPIDATIEVFGEVVDSYTMKESCADGITVRIAYEPRLARVVVSDEQAREIEKYYDRCADEGSTDEQINASKIAMSKMTKILSHPERIKRLAADIVEHYERLCAEKPKVVQKAMIVCADRKIALKVLQEIISIRPAWGVAKKSDDDRKLSKDKLEKLLPLQKINLVATQGQNDSPELFNLCGTKDYRKKLDKQFKNDDSNFKVAIVVDMWITGFDVPSLAVMYIDKPLQKHTLIQTISRVNRVFDGKDKGIVVDFIGFKNAMLEAVKKYGSPQENPVDELKISLALFRNHLALLSELTSNFDAKKFFVGTPLERLNCLNAAAEFVQTKKDIEIRFMSLSKKLKAAYLIVYPSGEISEAETIQAQFFLAIRSIIFKQTKGSAPDAEIMNRIVEKMVEEALKCTGIENIVKNEKSVDLFSENFLRELDAFKMPVTKFNALLKLVKKNIVSYSRSNKVKSIEFDKRLKKIVDNYNSRDKLVFVNEVVGDFVDQLSEKLIQLLQDLEDDKKSFERLGITYEEKVFFDILVAVRDEHRFPYAEEKCLVLAKEIKRLIDNKSKFADWANRIDIKAQLESDLAVLLYKYGYPPEWDKEIFDKIIAQTKIPNHL